MDGEGCVEIQAYGKKQANCEVSLKKVLLPLYMYIIMYMHVIYT